MIELQHDGQDAYLVTAYECSSIAECLELHDGSRQVGDLPMVLVVRDNPIEMAFGRLRRKATVEFEGDEQALAIEMVVDSVMRTPEDLITSVEDICAREQMVLMGGAWWEYHDWCLENGWDERARKLRAAHMPFTAPKVPGALRKNN